MLHVRQPQGCCELLFAFGTGLGHAASAKPIVADYEEAPKGGTPGLLRVAPTARHPSRQASGLAHEETGFLSAAAG